MYGVFKTIQPPPRFRAAIGLFSYSHNLFHRSTPLNPYSRNLFTPRTPSRIVKLLPPVHSSRAHRPLCAVFAPLLSLSFCQTPTPTSNTSRTLSATLTPPYISAVALLPHSFPLLHSCNPYSCLYLSDSMIN